VKQGDGIIRGRPLWVCAMIFAATVAVYLPALPGGFIWDDDANVTVRALQPVGGLRGWDAFTEKTRRDSHFPPVARLPT
jgi:hypothetical protein